MVWFIGIWIAIAGCGKIMSAPAQSNLSESAETVPTHTSPAAKETVVVAPSAANLVANPDIQTLVSTATVSSSSMSTLEPTPLPTTVIPVATATTTSTFVSYHIITTPVHTTVTTPTIPAPTSIAPNPDQPDNSLPVINAVTVAPTQAPSPDPASIPTYVFPVRAEWVDYGPYHHDYPAADIFCPVGSAFLATTAGVVDFVNRVDLWDPSTNLPEYRGGMMVAIIGDDGWRYYGSHLSAVAEGIEPGVRVTTGQILGYTGKSGNAQGTPPHLHYGISHPTTPDDWKTRRGEIPPYEYLQAWQLGEMISPKP